MRFLDVVKRDTGFAGIKLEGEFGGREITRRAFYCPCLVAELRTDVILGREGLAAIAECSKRVLDDIANACIRGRDNFLGLREWLAPDYQVPGTARMEHVGVVRESTGGLVRQVLGWVAEHGFAPTHIVGATDQAGRMADAVVELAEHLGPATAPCAIAEIRP